MTKRQRTNRCVEQTAPVIISSIVTYPPIVKYRLRKRFVGFHYRANTEPAKSESILLPTCRPEIRKKDASSRIANQFLTRRHPAFVKHSRTDGFDFKWTDKQDKRHEMGGCTDRKNDGDNHMRDEMRNGRQTEASCYLRCA